MNSEKQLNAEDYKEPVCPFDSDFYSNAEPTETIPVRRVIEKLDKLLYEKNDIPGARRHLEFWERSAEAGRDLRGLLTVENELMGFYRQNASKEDAYRAMARGLELVPKLGMDDTVGGATTYLNAATVCKTFGEAERAAMYYERAKAVYERDFDARDERLAGLYNNYALALCDLNRFDEAEGAYFSALDIVLSGDRVIDAAITYLNLADLYFKKLGEVDSAELIEENLDKAEKIFDDENVVHDGYYAYVCEKCAPTYEYYGWFVTAKKLNDLADKIYDRT